MDTLLQNKLCYFTQFMCRGESDARFLCTGFFQGQGPSNAV